MTRTAGYPGQPIDPHTLGRRLRAIGISPRLARHTALMDLASELPALVFSRLLGFHQTTGDNWNRERQGFGADYAGRIGKHRRVPLRRRREHRRCFCAIRHLAAPTTLRHPCGRPA
ncbi:hypothetical protein [Streptomyces sp. NPDC002671]